MKRSKIKDHKRQGKTLTTPLNSLQMTHFSWQNKSIPEFLWIILLRGFFERKEALRLFQEISLCAKFYKDKLPETSKQMSKKDKPEMEIGLSLSQLSICPDEVFDNILRVISNKEDGLKAIKPLLLFENMPGYSRWKEKIKAEPSENDWEDLMFSVQNTLWHQSEHSTDCRWLICLFHIFSGKVKFNVKVKSAAERVMNYPNYKDGSAAPAVRSMEIGLSNLAKRDPNWAKNFWEVCYKNSSCFIEESKLVIPTLGAKVQDLKEIFDSLFQHFFQKISVSEEKVNIKHEISFGFAFYALRIVDDLFKMTNSSSLIGRFAIRTLVEIAITFSYLSKIKSDWKKYRNFGLGQIKLAFLKFEESQKSLPNFIDKDYLEFMCNEDFNEEFLDINLGHWGKMNLRKMAEKSETKKLYDDYYALTSSYLHGHWGAIRDSCYATCANPLHRLHRIPQDDYRQLSDVLYDACIITNKILDTLDLLYPPFSKRISTKKDIIN